MLAKIRATNPHLQHLQGKDLRVRCVAPPRLAVHRVARFYASRKDALEKFAFNFWETWMISTRLEEDAEPDVLAALRNTTDHLVAVFTRATLPRHASGSDRSAVRKVVDDFQLLLGQDRFLQSLAVRDVDKQRLPLYLAKLTIENGG